MKRNTLAVFYALAASLLPSHAVGQTAPVEIKVFNETIPPGGTVQFKVSLTEPRPIMTGTKSFAMDDWAYDGFYGVSVSSPLGDAFGVASYARGQFSIRYLSPLGSFGTALEYPMITMAAHVRSDAPLGAQSLVSIGANSFTDPLGQTLSFVQNRPGILTVGGKLAIHNIVPGGGTWDSGTVIKILGTGFSKSTTITARFKYSPRFISGNEIDLVLAQPTTMDAQPIVLTEKVGNTTFQCRYFSYDRGVEANKSSFPVVASAIPVFPLLTVPEISVNQEGPGLNGNTLTALALQNNNPLPVTVTLTASTPMGRIARISLILAYGEKVTRELGEYFASPLPIGARVQVQASGPLQFVPFLADQGTGVLTPFAPSL